MTLPELLQYFTTSDTIGENKEAVDIMRFYSREPVGKERSPDTRSISSRYARLKDSSITRSSRISEAEFPSLRDDLREEKSAFNTLF